MVDAAIIHDLYNKKIIYPPRFQIYRAIELCPIQKARVVIIGQDPYHGPGQANGLAFSVNKDCEIPPSLKNIYKELVDDLDVSMPKHGDLTKWAEQGVLLLNTILTVEQGKPLSHAGLGWQDLTTGIIKDLNEETSDVCYILWGLRAQEFKPYINAEENHIIESSHPSPFSAHKGFFGSKPFSRTNKFLIDCGDIPVDWSIE